MVVDFLIMVLHLNSLTIQVLCRIFKHDEVIVLDYRTLKLTGCEIIVELYNYSKLLFMCYSKYIDRFLLPSRYDENTFK